MKQKIQIIQSGIPLVDKAWGGFYRGGTYLLIGARKSGRTLLSLQFAMECARQKEVCLYFTSMRPKDLMIQAASIDFDLQAYMNQNLIIVVRVAPPADLYEVGNPDEFLAEYMNDIVTVVEQYQPNKIVFDEITPFIGFSDLSMLQKSFSATCETIEDSGITSLYVIGEPATPGTQAIVDSLAAFVTGTIHLKKEENSKTTSIQGGVMTISPNIGHTEGKVSSSYAVEPYKGITIDYHPERTRDEIKNFPSKPELVKTEIKYKSLADVDAPSENYTFTSFYNENDFKLILNNQIALYKSTGQVFTIVSFRLDKSAETKGILSLTQLQNAVRLSTDKKDKICILNGKVLVLITKEDPNAIKAMIGRVKANLPVSQYRTLDEMLQYISVYTVKVEDKIQNADDLLQMLTSDETEEKNKLYFH